MHITGQQILHCNLLNTVFNLSKSHSHYMQVYQLDHIQEQHLQ
jgi:hypothetical protein